MRVGVYAFATDQGLDPGRLAEEVEARGFDALMFPEHSHIPVARGTSYPDVYGGGDLPEFYQRTYDPFISCTMVAARTTRIKMGTGICLLALREPVNTAKLVASVDQISDGRFLFGVGFGWNADEFDTLGVPFKGRHALVRDKVMLMRELWTQDVASYDGELVQLQPSWAWPKPAQRPWPPLLLGGSGPLTMKHAAEWADVWYPTPPGDDPLMERAVPAFRRLLEDAGRDPATVSIGCAPGDATAADLDAYAAHGVDFVNIGMVTGTADDDLARLDHIAAEASAYLT
jgi:probable F420-dependent oxidoreductase